MSIEAIKKALEGVTPDRVERLWWFLHVLAKSSGSTNAGDEKWNWINAFCTDYEDDTFNRAYKLGFIKVSHDSFMETSKAGMTPAGFSFINYFEKAPSVSLISEIDRLQRENALMQERTADYPTISAKLHDREKAREAEQRDCREAIARAEAAEVEVKRLQAELALSKPLYSRRQIEARVKSLEEALKPFADLAPSYDPPEDDDDHKCWHAESTPTLGDLRRARNTLASTGGDHHAE